MQDEKRVLSVCGSTESTRAMAGSKSIQTASVGHVSASLAGQALQRTTRPVQRSRKAASLISHYHEYPTPAFTSTWAPLVALAPNLTMVFWVRRALAPTANAA